MEFDLYDVVKEWYPTALIQFIEDADYFYKDYEPQILAGVDTLMKEGLAFDAAVAKIRAEFPRLEPMPPRDTHELEREKHLSSKLWGSDVHKKQIGSSNVCP